MELPHKSVNNVTFFGGSSFIYGNSDGEFGLVDVSTKKIIGIRGIQQPGLLALTLNKATKMLGSIDSAGRVKLWQLDEREYRASLEKETVQLGQSITSGLLLPDYSKAAVTLGNGSIVLIKL
jgi:hypothetical protein